MLNTDKTSGERPVKKWVTAILLMLVVGSLLVGCDENKEDNMTTKEFNLSGFTNVEVGGAFDVEIVQSDTFSVSVTADDFPHIRVEKVNDTLVIKRQGIEWLHPFHSQPKARISMPSLADLTFSGASKGKIQNFNSANNFSVTVSGASHLEALNMSAGSLETEISGAASLTGDIKASGDAKLEVAGASKLDLEGAANNITLKASGASKADLNKFPTQNADVDVSGASSGTINLNGKLNANVSGASNLYWSGTPLWVIFRLQALPTCAVNKNIGLN